jgi:nitrous oxidase accessory protein NosD
VQKRKTLLTVIRCVCLLAVLSLLFAAAPITAKTYIVSEKSDEYSIQSAINKAKDGDRIIVKIGTYSERLNITKKLSIKGVDTGNGLPAVNGQDIFERPGEFLE